MPKYLAGVLDARAKDMRTAKKNGAFRVRALNAKEHDFKYHTFQLTGYLAGARIRRRFKTREQAWGEKIRLEVLAANSGEIRSHNTRP